jgi:hypothetical protein
VVAHQFRLARLRGFQNATFGSEGSIGSFFEIPARIDTLAPELIERMEQPGHVIQRLDQRSPGVLMPRNETRFEFKTNLETFTTKAGSGVAATKHWLGYMLEAAFGTSSSRLSTGTTISGTASTTTAINVTDASTHRAGGAIGIVNASTGLLEIREIESVDTGATPDQIVVKMAFGAAPTTAGVTVYGAATYFLHNHPNGVASPYMQFALEGYALAHRWFLPTGALESFTIDEFVAPTIPQLGFKWMHPSWFSANGTDTTMNLLGTLPTGIPLARSTYINTVLNTSRAMDLRLRDVTSSALPTQLAASKVAFKPNIKYEEIPSLASTVFSSSVSDYIRVETYPEYAVDVNYEVPMGPDLTIDAAQAAGTLFQFTAQFGSSATYGGVLLSVPRAQIKEKPAIIGIGGTTGRAVSLGAMQDTEAVSAGATVHDDALAEAAFRIHFV